MKFNDNVFSGIAMNPSVMFNVKYKDFPIYK